MAARLEAMAALEEKTEGERDALTCLAMEQRLRCDNPKEDT